MDYNFDSNKMLSVKGRCIQVISVVLLLMNLVLSDTVFYTNSPRHLVTSENYTSYKLAVPGADPITIIEATQGTPRDDTGEAVPGSLSEIRRQVKDEEFLFHRKNYRDGHGGGNSETDQNKPRTTVYSPDLLRKFLDDYAAKVRKSTTEKKEKLQEILLFDDDNEEQNFPLNSRPEEKYGSHDWNQKNKYPPDRRYDRPNSGWVTMDVIPWSSSKVSKWQGHVQKLPSRPIPDDHSRPDYVSMEDFDDRFSGQSYSGHNYRPHRPSHHDNDFDDVDRFSNHHHHQHQHHSHNKHKFPENRPPYYNYQGSSSNQHNNFQSSNDRIKDVYRPWRGDLITDNRAPDFPDHEPSYQNANRRPSGGSIYDNYSGEYRPYDNPKGGRPTASPESGNGEWILVSTTKGYHRPRHGQRAVSVTPQSFTSHKTVQLNVKTDKEKPSTFSFDTHRDDQNYSDQSGEASLHSPVTQASVRKPPTTSKQPKKVLKKVMNVKTSGMDSSAVLAAVGAGMVPATVAMLMPMIAGRRKKRDLSTVALGMPRNVTHFPDLDYEETLPRILQRRAL